MCMSDGRPTTRVIIELGMPTEHRKERHATPRLSVEDKVREALDLIESGHESSIEWRMISRLYRDLKAMSGGKRKSPRVRNLIKMIEPVLAKYGYHGVDAGV